MKYRIIATSRFEKDVKRCKKRNLPMEKLNLKSATIIQYTIKGRFMSR